MSAAASATSTAADAEDTSSSVFQTKYEEFAEELLSTFPEFEPQIRAAIAIPEEERLRRFQTEVKIAHIMDRATNPGILLPGVPMPDAVWASLSASNQGALWEYVRLLSMCCFLEGGFGGAGGDGGGAGEDTQRVFFDQVMGEWKSKLESVDFEGLMGKFSKIFPFLGGGGGSGADGDATDASGGATGGFKMPNLPEKFLKGHLAKLAEEIVKDIKPEDLGLTAEMMAECEKSPSKAFELLIQTFTKNPGAIQNAIQKIGKRLQQKIQTGAIRPQEIAREAEELMKEFAENSEFVGLMESFKSAFGFEDMGLARQAGKEQSARMAIVKERLRKKLDAKNAASGGAGAGAGAHETTNTVVELDPSDPFWSGALGGNEKGAGAGAGGKAKKGKKK
jgi:hypothetical protein